MNLAYQYAKTKYFFKNMKVRYFLGEDQNENNNNTIRRAKKMGAITTNEDNPHFGTFPLMQSSAATTS